MEVSPSVKSIPYAILTFVCIVTSIVNEVPKHNYIMISNDYRYLPNAYSGVLGNKACMLTLGSWRS